MKRVLVFIILAIAVMACSCQSARKSGGKKMEITVTSTAFSEGDLIPKKYTGEGANVSPPLKWSGVPEGTKSIALIADDPDAPMGTWVHWVVYDLPANLTELPEAVPHSKKLSNGALQGLNDSKGIGYSGPMPPSGTHRYYFKVYALNTEINLGAGATKAAVEKAMQGHILAKGQLMGRYSRASDDR